MFTSASSPNSGSGLYGSLRQVVARHADAVALSGPAGRSWTYAQLLAALEQIAADLRRSGVQPGDRVGLVAPSGPEGALAVLAVACCCTAAPLPAGLATPALAERIRRLAPRLLMVPDGSDDATAAAGAAATCGVPMIKQPAGARPSPPQSHSLGDPVGWGQAADAALVLTTSGTTAEPRLVPLSHANLLAAADSIRVVLQVTPEDRCLDPMPLAHIHGLSLVIASLLSGSRLHLPDTFAQDSVLEAWQQLRPTWYSAAPAMHALIADWLEQRPELLNPSSLRFVRSASGPMPRPLLERLERLLAVPLIEAYGMTEAAPQISSNRLPPDPRKPGSVGKAAGPEIAILDAQGEPLPPGATGEVAIRGANVMAGYLDDPEANRLGFRGDWLRTGDLGHCDADGDLFLSGRLAERIERGGLAIAPEPIEALLLSHPLVCDAAVFPVPHPLLGQMVAAAVVLVDHPGLPQNDLIQELRDLILEHLAATHVPQPLLVVRELPLQAGGKRRRRDLAEHFGLGGTERPIARPLSEAERYLADLWAQVLGTAPETGHDNFFLAGGQSLAAASLVARLRDSLGLDLPLAWVFSHPTLEGQAADLGQRLMARLLKARSADHPAVAPPGPPADPRFGHDQTLAPLSPAQQGLWLLDRMGQGSAYAMAMGWEFRGPLDPQLLQAALQLLIERQSALSCVFRLVGERPLQQLRPATPLPLPVIDASGSDAVDASPVCERHASRLRVAPFDLEEGPLLRAELIRLAPSCHRLHVAVHHIVFDRWSAGLFQRELVAVYGALLAGHDPALPPLPLTVLDVARRLTDRLGVDGESQRQAFWKTRLAGAPLLSTFPSHRPRPETLSGRGASLRRPLSLATWECLEALAREHAVTPYMVVLAGFSALLGRYGGQNDVVVGSPHAQRSEPDVASLMGCFATSVPLRTDLRGDPDVPTLLRRVRDGVLPAFDHAELAMDRLVDLLEIPRRPRHTPLFQVMLAFQNLPQDGLDRAWLSDALEMIPVAIDDPTSKFDLSLYLEFNGGEAVARWQYSTDLYDQEGIVRLAGHFEALLERMVADPGQPLSRLTRLPDAERQRLVRLASGPRRPQLRQLDVVRRIEAQAQAAPEAVALVGRPGLLGPSSLRSDGVAPGTSELSYTQLNATANRLARVLRRHGVETGSRIGLLLPRTPDAILCQLALLKLGVCFVGLDPAHPAERLRWMADDADLSAVLTTADTDALPNHTQFRLEALSEAMATELDDDLGLVPDPASPAYLLYTSGSTGHPRGVLVSRANLSHYGPALAAALDLAPSDRWLLSASFSFSSSIRQAFVPLMNGACVVVAPSGERSDPLALWRWIREQRVSVVDLVPTHWRICHAALAALDAEDRQELLEVLSLRLMLSASEPMPATLPQQWAPLLERGVRLFNLYGQTETTGIVTAQPIQVSDADRGGLMPIGRPIANLRCLVRDVGGQIQPIGTPGELWIGGAGIGAGYWRPPERTADPFVADEDHPGEWLYRSGDRAVLQADGSLLLLGRSDGQLKQAGVRVEPGEIEAILLRDDRVSRAVAVAAATEDPGAQPIVAFVETVADGHDLRNALRRLLDRHLPAAMQPSSLRIRERLPLTDNGKVDRRALALEAGRERPPADKPIARRRYLAPRTDREQRLAAIWADVLDLPRVGIDDNFFELGGDSLRSVQAVERARAAGLPLDLAQHFRHQTIGGLAAACWSTAEAPPPTPMAPAQGLSASGPADGGGERLLIPIEPLRAFGERLLRQVGLEPEGARIVTDVQLESSLRGQPTHNIDSLPRYARRLRAGTLNGRPELRIEVDRGMAIALDGDNAPGQWVASVAMELAIERARQHGFGLVTARRSNHYGAAGHYAWMAARQGLIGFTTTNGPVVLAPTGGTTPTFGNNPIAVGIPALRYPAVLLDIALTVAPRGRIALTVARGAALPPGWILDRHGRPSTDLGDLAAGLGMPIGGHKGYGLALVMEILAGVMSGAGFGLDHGRHLLGAYAGGADFGHVFLAMDPALQSPADRFLERVDRLIAQTKAGELAEGSEGILIPGERELLARQRHLAEGHVPLSIHSWRQLQRYVEETGLTGLPEPLPARSGP